jgi:hypothetical protein
VGVDMAYKYYNSDPRALIQKPGDIWLEDFQALVNDQYYTAPDAYTIQEETVIGTNVFQNVEVRVNRGINTYTGEKLGDDFKLILFRDLAHSTSVGYKYYFDNNFWISINSEKIKNFAGNCLVKRCNNVLRWVDEYGNYYEEPCSIDYKISRPKDMMGAVSPVQPQGYMDVYCQINDRTRKIKGNQRFLFGIPDNRIGYKVFGDGVRNFLNQKTYDESSSAIMILSMGGNYVNAETDDIVNGIADVKQIVYDVSISPTFISGSISNEFQIIPTITYNGNFVSVPMSYSSSASFVASVNNNGLVTFDSDGSAIITAYMTKNTSASGIVSVTVSSSPINYKEIRFDPEPAYILEGGIENYNLYLYENGVYNSSASFVFSFINNAVPNDHYFVSSGSSSLSVANLSRYLINPLTIDCFTDGCSRQIEIDLRGAW